MINRPPNTLSPVVTKPAGQPLPRRSEQPILKPIGLGQHRARVATDYLKTHGVIVR